jgi:hypothetical protein
MFNKVIFMDSKEKVQLSNPDWAANKDKDLIEIVKRNLEVLNN